MHGRKEKTGKLSKYCFDRSFVADMLLTDSYHIIFLNGCLQYGERSHKRRG